MAILATPIIKMGRFSKGDIATYYNHTLYQYKVGWQLNKSRGVHFGLWYNYTENLHEAILNTNKKIGNVIGESKGLKLLDAGCGVGGTAIFLAQNYNCHVEGITLSSSQCQLAEKFIKELNLNDTVNVSINDYTQTDFPDHSFDMVYAIESICHAREKSEFYKEAFRLLKPGGRLVFMEYIKTSKGALDQNRSTLNWLLHRWAIEDIDTYNQTVTKLKETGFEDLHTEDLTVNVWKSVKIMWRRAMFGIITIPLYAILHPGKYQFSRRHPESGWALHKCFRKKLMEYWLFSAVKPDQEK